MPTKTDQKTNKTGIDKSYFIITYLFILLSGVVMLLLYGSRDKRLKFHSLQAIALGIIAIVVSVLFGLLSPILSSLISVLIWVYGMYIGLEAYAGKDVDIPVVSDFVHSIS
jgi:Chloroplast import component protein (Tic20).